MLRKKVFILFLIIFAINFVSADNHTLESNSSSLSEFSSNAQLEVGPGITPDSSFYFVEDKFLSKFRNDLENREKKIAEVKEMINKGDIESARKSLLKYKLYADRLEKEVDPELKAEAQRSAEAIRVAIREIESEIPESERKDFIDSVDEQEKRIDTAAQVADKIRELCESLSKLDPLQYSRTCKTDDETPRWQKDLDEKLTDEQEKEAKEFFNIMSQCFENPKGCQCEKITIQSFANSCSEIAPLAAKCMDGDQSSCEKMDEIPDPAELLPPHLQAVMEKVEGKYDDSKHDNFGPPECREAGVKTRAECEKIMFKLNAPEECIKALEDGRLKFDNERESRKTCEEIMFKENAPEECIKAGLKDHKECGRYMFKLNAPEECIQAGLTGESPRDHKECEKIMKNQRGDEGQGQGKGPALGRNCMNIEDKSEKLKCFEDSFESSKGRDFKGEEFNQEDFGEKGKERNNNWPEECKQANALTPESCRAVMNKFGENQRRESEERYNEEDKNRYEEERKRSESMNEEERRKYETEREGNYNPNQQQGPPPGQSPPPSDSLDSQHQSDSSSKSESSSSPSGSSSSSDSSSSSSSSDSSSGPSSSDSSSSSESSGSSGVTGSVIAGDNVFLKYFFRI